ncbi:MAG: reverse transcriptase domain-containing protein [Trichodesmium sp. St16_bin2-tuft]|jgi:group II intron reverse transcriptase/maturase|nr:reverse transcriptase domain-containing protein [Trichodesmium sp. St18_bin1]MDE5089084.1 reverse transcriptase domain-containing protein [Trichodesmium sp. St16_bin2-tuft]MDE5124501.1 reverse transcriptase domain-containing protein [Trichodesmium sp. St19_bin1]
MSNNHSEAWKNLDWKKFQRDLLRLQKRIYKAMQDEDLRKVRSLQHLVLKSRAARMLAVRQVSQLNSGKKTCGVDGQKSLNFQQRLELAEKLKEANKWEHKGLREVQIPKKNGKMRTLKIPTIADRAWQCLVKYALEPAHEATFHARSYGFRPGRSTHDAQRYVFTHLQGNKNSLNKRVIELDIEKCFDRISHSAMMSKVIAPQRIKKGLWRCLKAGVSPEFPEQGTPQGGVVSPLLANIALNGIEEIHPSLRYADDMVFFLKPKDNAEKILEKVQQFLAERGMNISAEKTKTTRTTAGFDFLGWHFKVLGNGKYRCVPSEDNYEKFRKKIKAIVNNPALATAAKAKKLTPIVRGWRNYHRYCKMDGSRFNLWSLNHSTFVKFKKDKNKGKEEAARLVQEAFPAVPYSVNGYVMVKGKKSPYDGDLLYWSKRNSKLYSGETEKALKRQGYKCGQCGLYLDGNEKIHLHHIDGNHDNWKSKNLIAIHESCHDYIHMGKSSQS